MAFFRSFTILCCLVLALTACGLPTPVETGEIPASDPVSTISETPSSNQTYPPVENRKANTDFTPAFEGQTRAPGVRTQTPYRAELLDSSLQSPWAVSALPDNRLVITEKAGTIRLYDTVSDSISAAITGFPPVDNRSQGGLLDVAPSPDFLSDRKLYFTFAERTDEGSVTAVGYGVLNEEESEIENFTIIYRATPYYDNSMHFGSRLLFAEDGTLYVSTGERSDLATRAKAQQLDNAYGKVLHITVEGEAVQAEVEGGLPEIYTYGHRNVQGLARHPLTGDLWISEMGPRGGDELNLLSPGSNYGWGEVSYGEEYNGRPVGEGIRSREDVTEPIYYWDPVLAPSGMTFYESSAIPEWENNLFIGGLAGQHISRLVIENDRVMGEERLLADLGERFRDIGMGFYNDEADALYFVTDSGKLFRLISE